MSELFDRKISLRFGRPGEVGVAYEAVRIKFQIERTSEPAPNKSKIQVYNLNETSRSLTERSGLVAVLSAGYRDEIENLFTGDVARVITSLEGSDYVSEFECGDGERSYRTARLDLTVTEGFKLKDLFMRAAESMGMRITDTSAIEQGAILNGVSLSGLTRKHLDDLTSQFGLEWSIQDGQMQVLRKDEATSQTAVLLTPKTGLIGIPRKRTEGGIECVSLLQPKIKPGRQIKLESRFISGTFRVSRVTHSGDTHGSEWFSTIECLGGTV